MNIIEMEWGILLKDNSLTSNLMQNPLVKVGNIWYIGDIGLYEILVLKCC